MKSGYYNSRILSVMILVFTLISSLLHAQIGINTDSLIKELEESISDEERLEILGKLVKEYSYTDSSQTSYYYNLLIPLAKQLNNREATIDANYNMAWNLMSSGHLPEAEKQFKNILDESRENSYTAGLALAYNGMGSVEEIRGNYSKAIELYYKTLEESTKAGDENLIANTFMNIGLVKSETSDYQGALQLYFKSLEIYIKLKNNRSIANSYNKIGLVYRNMGNYNKSLDYFFLALTKSTEIGHKKIMSASLNNIGDVYIDQNNFNNALVNYRKALTLREETGDRKGIAICYSNLGHAYLNFNDLQQAEKYFGRAESIYLEIGDVTGLAYVFVNQGRILSAIGNYQKAIFYFTKSKELYIKTNNRSGLANALVFEGKLQFDKGYSQLAADNLQKAFEIARSIHEPVILKDASEVLAQIYAAKNQYKSAYEYFRVFKDMADTILNQANTKRITQMEMQYEFAREKDSIQEKNLKQQQAQNKKLQRQRILNFGFLAGFLILSVLALLLYRNFRIKQKAAGLLARQKEEILNQAQVLKSANEKLKELNEFKQAMTNMIVHDLKNPLNSIINIPDSVPSEQELVHVRQLGLQMLNLVMNILDVNKYEKLQMKLSPGPGYMADIINNSIEQVAFLAFQKNICIKYKLPKIKLNLDIEIIERVFVNLLTNAIKYTPTNGSVFIDLINEQSGTLKFRVIDTGPGVPKEKADLVFAEFGQILAKKAGDVRSTGLGLTFCRLAIEAHGGRIGFEDNQGAGTIFWFTLPRERLISENGNFELLEYSSEKKQYPDLDVFDKEILAPVVNTLKDVDLYSISKIRKLLNQIEGRNEKIREWKEKILDASYSGNTELYSLLLNLVDRPH